MEGIQSSNFVNSKPTPMMLSFIRIVFSRRFLMNGHIIGFGEEITKLLWKKYYLELIILRPVYIIKHRVYLCAIDTTIKDEIRGAFQLQ